MKITELDLQTEGKRYFCKQINEVVEVKEGNIVGIKTNLNLASLLHMDFEEYTSKANPYTRVDVDNTYYLIAPHSIVNHVQEKRCCVDDKMFEVVNYFNNKEYARYIAFKENLMRRMDKFAWEHNKEVIDWFSQDNAKYYIYYDCYDNVLEIDCTYGLRMMDSVYFVSRELAERAACEFKEDLIKLYTWKF